MKNTSIFTAIVKREGKQPRHIANCVIHKGKVVALLNDRLPFSYNNIRPYFNKDKFPEGMTNDQVIALYQKTGDKGVFDEPILFDAMFVLGDNGGGCTVVNKDAAAADEAAQLAADIEAGKHPVHVFMGVFGLCIQEKLGPKLWPIVKPYAEYHSGNEDEMEFLDDQYPGMYHPREVRGWYFSVDAIRALLEKGVKVKYLGEELQAIADMAAIEQQKRAAEEADRIARREIKNEVDEMVHLINNLPWQRTPDALAEAISRTPKRLAVALDYSGPTIYGSGRWFHFDTENMYHVKNNGHDGDMWSLNNYPTGGAGAICAHCPKSDAKEVIAKLDPYLDRDAERPSPAVALKLFLVKHGIEPTGEDIVERMTYLFVEQDKLWLGMDPETGQMVAGTRSSNLVETYPAVFHDLVMIPVDISHKARLMDQLPQWAIDALDKKPAQPGRYFVSHYVYPDNVYALLACWRYDHPVNTVSHAPGSTLRYIEKPNSHGVTIWSDGRVIKHMMCCFNMTTTDKDRSRYSQPAWLPELVNDYHLETLQASDKAKEVLRYELHGFQEDELIGLTGMEKVKDIREMKARSADFVVSEVQLSFPDGRVKKAWLLSGGWAAGDQSEEISELHADISTAIGAFERFAKN